MDKIKGLDKLITDALNNGFFPSANYCLVVKDKSYFNSFGNKTLISFDFLKYNIQVIAVTIAMIDRAIF